MPNNTDEAPGQQSDFQPQDPDAPTSEISGAAALELSREFLHRFWAGDANWCKRILSPDFVWIGALAKEFGQSLEPFLKEHDSIISYSPRVIISDEEYHVLPSSSKRAFVVIAQYLGHTDPASGTAFSDRQRLSLVWRATPDGLRLFHYHVSNPLKATIGAEPFPTSFAKETYRYAMALSQQHGRDATHELRDVEGNLNLLRLADVTHLEAQRQSTIVHCVSRTFRVRSGITDVAKRIDPETNGALVRTHRSYVANALYVDRVGRDTVHLTTGEELPLSAQRRSEVEAQVKRFFDAE